MTSTSLFQNIVNERKNVISVVFSVAEFVSVSYSCRKETNSLLSMTQLNSRSNCRLLTRVPKKLNSVAVGRKRTIPTERPPLGEVNANLCG
jgi:hypothetical protein